MMVKHSKPQLVVAVLQSHVEHIPHLNISKHVIDATAYQYRQERAKMVKAEADTKSAAADNAKREGDDEVIHSAHAIPPRS